MEVANRLGLHLKGTQPKAGDYVGLVWWPGQKGKTALCVTPKFKNMDYLAMYLECLQHPDVSPHMDKCFFFWPEEPLIEIQRSQIPLNQAAAPFAALAFVRELHDMVRRNMRKNFIRQEENLTGRFKGRLLMSRHVRKNLLNARPDRNYCQYGVISEDCRENQILLAALDRCARKLLQHDTVKKDANILRMIRVCRTALQGVTLRRHIHNRDFAGIRYTGTFIHYKRPHALAKLILNSQELDPSVRPANETGAETVKVVPFALCTSELFERYTEVKLREMFGADSGLMPDWTWNPSEQIAGKIHGISEDILVRPDFLIPVKDGLPAWILDSKYKRPEGNDYGVEQKDFRQILKYAAHDGVLKELNFMRKVEVNNEDLWINLHNSRKLYAVLIYPKISDNAKEKVSRYIRRYNEAVKLKPRQKEMLAFYEYYLPCPTSV